MSEEGVCRDAQIRINGKKVAHVFWSIRKIRCPELTGGCAWRGYVRECAGEKARH